MKLFSKQIDPKTTVNTFTGGSHSKELNDLEKKWTNSPTGYQINQKFDKLMHGSTPQKDTTND